MLRLTLCGHFNLQMVDVARRGDVIVADVELQESARPLDAVHGADAVVLHGQEVQVGQPLQRRRVQTVQLVPVQAQFDQTVQFGQTWRGDGR